ncbi:MAG: hypothetical protein Q8S73_16105 [Deltaproteobacteria bacterium]|nr:hypothetical protein [Myxococcales bacterium]MDP3215631.1 hypothetical protein [Deltaproteobacteria bacterium]
MRRARWSLLGALALGACDLVEAPAAPRCVAVAGEATPPVEQVCARLSAMDCRLPDCAQAYASYAARVSPAEFNRLTSCYVHATSCAQVGECELACGADGGAVLVGAPTDASTDASADVSADVSADAGDDSGTDSGVDAGSDSGTGVGMDVGTDVGSDTGQDSGTDVGSDAGEDAAD